jgi:hypothetical protein
MFRMEEGKTRRNKTSFFSRLNPFSRKQNDVPEKKEEKTIVAKKRIKLSSHFKRNRKKFTSKYRNSGRPWWAKIGLSARPDNNSLTPLKPFGTFAKIGRFV